MVGKSSQRTSSFAFSRSLSTQSFDVTGQRVLYSSSTGKLKFSALSVGDDNSTKQVNSCIECWGCRNEALRPILLRSIFLIVVATALLFSGLIMHFSIFGQDDLVLTEGDMIHLPVSTYFCSGVKYTVKGKSNILVHMLAKEPTLSSTQRHYRLGKMFTLPSWSYQHWTMNLLQGSSVRMKICTDQFLNFIVMKGKQSFQEWTENLLYDDHFIKKGIPASKSCQTSRDYYSVAFHIDESDEYYLMYSSSSGFTFMTTVFTYMYMNRTVYNLSNHLSARRCNHSESCASSLRYKSTDTSVVEILGSGGKSPDPFKTMKLSLSPMARFWFYAALFGGIFSGFLLLTLVYSLYRLLVKSLPKEKEETPLIGHLRGYKHYTRRIPKRTRKPSPWIVCIPEENEKDTDSSKLERHPSQDSQYGYDMYSNYSLLLTSCEEGGPADQSTAYTRHPSIHGDTRNEDSSHYPSERQLVDSCMTSASISAI